MSPAIDRRGFLVSFPALMMAPRVMAQSSSAPITVRGINHVTLHVSDLKRSVDFYQGLFGMPVRGRQGQTTLLQLGPGPQFIAIAPVAGGAAPSITHYCLGIEGFNVDRVMAALVASGVSRSSPRHRS